MAVKARSAVMGFGKGVAKNSRSLVDDAKNFAKPPVGSAGAKKPRMFFAKSMARNPVAQAGAAALVGGVAAKALSKKDNKNSD
jgi:hypothetical protein